MTSSGCCPPYPGTGLQLLRSVFESDALRRKQFPQLGSLLTQLMGLVCSELVSVVQGSKLCKLQRWLQ